MVLPNCEISHLLFSDVNVFTIKEETIIEPALDKSARRCSSRVTVPAPSVGAGGGGGQR